MHPTIEENCYESEATQQSNLEVEDVPTQAHDEAPPDGGYGWICVAACFNINCFTWGVVASYGVFLEYYLENDIYPGASDLDFAFIGGLNFSMAMLVAPIVTALARQYGIHVPMLVGITLQTIGFITASFAKRTWHLYLTQGVLVGFGSGWGLLISLASPFSHSGSNDAVAWRMASVLPDPGLVGLYSHLWFEESSIISHLHGHFELPAW
jgi:hypothetical protein